MEEFNTDSLIALYTQLRDASGKFANEVTDQLKEIIKVPQSIICFFDVITQSTNHIFRIYATLNVRDYLVVHKSDISQESLQNVRKLIIECLVNEKNSTARLQLIAVISILINYFPDDWPELNQFIYTEDYSPFLSSILQIFNIIFKKISDDELESQMEYYMQLVLAGFQSDDFHCNYNAVYFFFSILIKVDDTSQFEVFQDPLFDLLEATIKKQDAKILAKFLELIKVGIYNNIIFLPMEKVFTLILPILNSEIEIDIKNPLNNLIGLYLQFDTKQITTETLEQIFNLEINLAIELYDLSIDDPTLSWINDCISVFEGIYMRISEETVVQMSVTQFKELVDQKEPKFILSAISALISAISVIPENFDSQIDTIFSQLLNLLDNKDKYIQKFASEALSNIAPDFTDFITNNITEIVNAILFFIKEGVENGTSLLSAIINSTSITDEIFPSLLPTVLEWIKSPDPVMKQDATMILYSLIDNSQYQIPKFFEEITADVISLLKDSLENHYLLYIIIKKLCDRIPDLMTGYLSEFIPIITEGINSTDPYVKGQAIQTIEHLTKALPNNTEYQEFMMKIYNELLEIANAQLEDTEDDQIRSISGAAVFQASNLVCYLKKSELLPSILPAVVHIARLPSMNCIYFAAKSFRYLTYLIMYSPIKNDSVTDPTDEMIDILIEKLNESSRYEFDILNEIIKTIAESIRTCGIGILKCKELELFKILSSVLTHTMNPYTGALICPDDILDSISDLFFNLANSTNENITKDILEALFPILTEFLDHKSYEYQVFSINTFSRVIPLMADDMKQELIQIMPQRIEEAVPKVASAAAHFIYNISKEERVDQLKENIVPVLTALMEKLEGVTNLTTDNIFMRENLLLAVSSIGTNVLVKDFPIEETMPVILKSLPVVKQFRYNKEVYKFLNSKKDQIIQELKPEYIRVYSWFFARPKSQLKIYSNVFDPLFLKETGNILDEFLNEYSEEEQKEMIENFLDSDEYKLKCFAESFESVKEFANSIIDIRNEMKSY